MATFRFRLVFSSEGDFAMNKIRKAARFSLFSAALALLSWPPADVLHAQEIRAVAEPNQSVRMGRGGYVCEGQLTHTPIDATENWTYEMVQCTGSIYNAEDYAALHAKLNHDELMKLNTALERLNATSMGTQDALNKQIQVFNNDLRATIDKRFKDLPNDLLSSPAIQNLKKSLIEYIDQRLPKTPQTKPRVQPSAPPNGPPSSAPPEP
jgi:hypothetical protein